MLPAGGLMIGTVQGHNTDGTSTLTDAAGREFTAQGQGVAIGDKAFVRNGLITGTAPDLPFSIETV